MPNVLYVLLAVYCFSLSPFAIRDLQLDEKELLKQFIALLRNKNTMRNEVHGQITQKFKGFPIESQEVMRFYLKNILDFIDEAKKRTQNIRPKASQTVWKLVEMISNEDWYRKTRDEKQKQISELVKYLHETDQVFFVALGNEIKKKAEKAFAPILV